MALPSPPQAHLAQPGLVRPAPPRWDHIRQNWLCIFTHRRAWKAWLALKSLGEEARDSLLCHPLSCAWPPWWKELLLAMGPCLPLCLRWPAGEALGMRWEVTTQDAWGLGGESWSPLHKRGYNPSLPTSSHPLWSEQLAGSQLSLTWSPFSPEFPWGPRSPRGPCHHGQQCS